MIASSGSTTNPYRYGGKYGYYTETYTGLVLATQRWYLPNMMRWISRDPIGYEGGVNLYEYVLSNPMRYADPTGLDIWIEGSSGNEPNLHWSIHVGNPNGRNNGFSFSLDGGGSKYFDFENGGKILRYIKTPENIDRIVRHTLENDLLNQDRTYFLEGNCRDYSYEWFETIKKVFRLRESTPPLRPDPSRHGRGKFTYYLSSSQAS